MKVVTMGTQWASDGQAPQVRTSADRPAVARLVARQLIRALRETVEAEGIAHVSLTGGGAGIATLEAVAGLVRHSPSACPEWSRVHFWWGDERLLPDRDAQRNEVQARDALLDALVAEGELPEQNIHPMPNAEQAADPATGAAIYAQALQRHAPPGGIRSPHGQLEMPPLAVMLLGMGPDGHINSLFPGKDSLEVTGRPTTGEPDSPKPPPLRVTMTFDAVKTARRVWLVVTGEDKADAAARALAPGADPRQYPAADARGLQQTIWYLDQAAASRL